MVTAENGVEARLSLHLLATARTRAIHKNEALAEDVAAVLHLPDRSKARITPRSALQRKA